MVLNSDIKLERLNSRQNYSNYLLDLSFDTFWGSRCNHQVNVAFDKNVEPIATVSYTAMSDISMSDAIVSSAEQYKLSAMSFFNNVEVYHNNDEAFFVGDHILLVERLNLSSRAVTPSQYIPIHKARSLEIDLDDLRLQFINADIKVDDSIVFRMSADPISRRRVFYDVKIVDAR